ncbi:hypothetical protein A2917_00385 [Candidatus Nomurabacteria bacterium RIFCSPLOWO2_01_FULL_42_17]|uniref:EfeO-type cupredoxin-like domain-containing protein n=1 Tax=Candidatus Nomurabacteria bacterium RIFCSPLOWO2_01_FULL_42_17 TaxID=1801780 RepID=A0A1F6XNX1_9BACT|nr:MAG: hypothetical protein A2917_00385 [Candidatus Nomurabacteria bacterium RIFCSPLOWO2_01_FULL_42_17]
MKKNYIIIIILIILVAGAVFFLGKGKRAEAPAGVENNQINTTLTPTITASVITPAVREFTVVGQNFSFTPSLLTVQKGDRVKIIFKNENGFHDFKIDEFGIATQQAQSPNTGVLEFTADKIGSFEYYCSVGSHRAAGMKGTLRVE